MIILLTVICYSSFFFAVFYSVNTLLGVKTTSSYYRERMLEIKYRGRMNISSKKYKFSNFNILRIYIEMLGVYQKHVIKLETAYIRCHIKLKINIKESLTFRYLVFFIGLILAHGYFIMIFLTNNYFHLIYLLLIYWISMFLFMYGDYLIFNFIFKIKKAEVLKELMYFINSYENGMSVGETTSTALYEANKEVSGLLHDEFSLVIEEYNSGVPLRVALNNMTKRLDVKEISDFVEFIKRNDDNSHLQISEYSKDARQEKMNLQAKLIKDKEATAPERINRISALGFTAIVISFAVPIIFPVFMSLK